VYRQTINEVKYTSYEKMKNVKQIFRREEQAIR